MSRQIEHRCIVQRDNTEKDKFYPKISSAYIKDTFPFTAQVATIEINTNIAGGTGGYMSPVRVDDIVRIQANITYLPTEKAVWQNLFEGRVMEIGARFGRDNMTTLECRGHAEELLYRLVTADYSASSTTTGAMLSTLSGLYLDRLTDDSPSQIDSDNSTSIGNYNIQQDTKYMIDVIRDMEGFEGLEYIFSVDPQYDADNNLYDVFMSWQPVPSTASKTVQIIEYTPRLISAQFSDSLEKTVEHVKIYGESGTPQKVGTSIDGSPQYGTRYHVGTEMSIASNTMCTEVATAIRDRYGDSMVKGSAQILGDPNIKVGDLIHCKIPSIELNGATIEGDYRCSRVIHQINSEGITTSVDLGDLTISHFEMVAGFLAKFRHENANNVD